MNVEEELPRLLDELADHHVVGPPPALDVLGASVVPSGGHRARKQRVATLTAAAAFAALAVGGLILIGTRPDESPVASPPTATSSGEGGVGAGSSATSTPDDVDGTPRSAPEGAVAPLLELVRIEARAEMVGTTSVVLVFDRDVPDETVELVDDITGQFVAGIGYLTQGANDDPTAVSLCGSIHGFPAGSGTVDILLPSDWFGPTPAFDVPVVSDEDQAASKIVVCEPRAGMVQVSVTGAASARSQDVSVSVHGNLIEVDIRPDPTRPRTDPEEADAPSFDVDDLAASMALFDWMGTFDFGPDNVEVELGTVGAVTYGLVLTDSSWCIATNQEQTCAFTDDGSPIERRGLSPTHGWNVSETGDWTFTVLAPDTVSMRLLHDDAPLCDLTPLGLGPHANATLWACSSTIVLPLRVELEARRDGNRESAPLNPPTP